MVWYFSNSVCHALSLSGGSVPVTGRHSTIERPEPVSRVAPPTTTSAKITSATTWSHSRTARRRPSSETAIEGITARGLSGRGGPYSHRAGAATPQPFQRQFAPELSMSMRMRKLIGTAALLALVIVWSLLAMAFAQIVLVRANQLVSAIYYVVAGLGWVLPAMPLISWMSRTRPDS